ncbi:MAG: hypothetical protein Q8R12_00585 [bacterium]|nr:hypothetical protein [bacterium]
MMKKVFKTLLVLLLTPAFYASAQTLGDVSSITIDLSPKVPAPLETVGARLSTFSFDADRAYIQWILDGRTLAAGTGVKDVSFQTGTAGSVSRLSVRVSPAGGETLEKTIEIRPAAIDLLIESESFLPSWYRGAAVAPPAGGVKVVAIANFVSGGSKFDPKTLIYNWSIDGEIRGDLSGRGRDSIKIKASRVEGDPIEVSVNISSPDNSIQARALTRIEAQKPKLLFYERRPLEGLVSSEALSARTIAAGSRFEVEAVPFFTNISSLKELVFSWKFDSAEIASNPREPNVFVVKSEAGGAGRAFIEAAIKNLKNILEEVSASFYVFTQ